MANPIAITADIVTLEVDAVVTAANAALSGGGGVDGAIHRAAGPELAAACHRLGRCAPGDAVVTEGYGLPARWVIHAVGPVWDGGGHGEAQTLRRTYRALLERADELEVRSLAIPAISCGAYRYPLAAAAAIACEEVRTWLAAGHAECRVLLCDLDPKVTRALAGRLDATP